MQKITEQPPPKEALYIAQNLVKLGFNVQLLSSRNHVLKKLQHMKAKALNPVKTSLHPT